MPENVTAGDRIVGSRIRLRRKQLGVNGGCLAQILGVTLRQLEDYESGAARLGAQKLAEVGKALDTPITYFFTGLSAVDRSKPRVPERGDSPVPDAIDFLSAYSRIANSQLRGAVLRLMLRLARESQGSASKAPGKGAGREHRWSSLVR